MTTETFQDLSLPIPSQETLAALRSQQISASAKNSSPTMSANTMSTNNEGWVSWIWSWFYGFLYGPNITLEDCLAYFFSADELKGDNMYSCEKCKNDSKKNCSRTANSLTNDSLTSDGNSCLQTSNEQSCSTTKIPTKMTKISQSTALPKNSQQNCPEMNGDDCSDLNSGDCSEMNMTCLNSQSKDSDSNDSQNDCQNTEKGNFFP